MKGFTLFEVVVYIALLVFLMTGTVRSVYQVLEASGQVSGKVTIQDEGLFVLHKINWALSGAKTTTLSGSGCTQTLAITKYDGTTIDIRFAGGNLEMRENGGTYGALVSSNAIVSCAKFQSVRQGSVSGVVATVTIHSTTFTTTKYLR